MSDNKKAQKGVLNLTACEFVEWYATQLEGYLATEGHNPEQVLKYILSKLENQSAPLKKDN